MDISNVFRSSTDLSIRTGRGTAGLTPTFATGVALDSLVRGLKIKMDSQSAGRFLYIGNENVDSAHGYTLFSEAEEFFPVDSTEDIYVIGSHDDITYSWWVV